MTLRALAPSGVPFSLSDIVHGLLAAMGGERSMARFRDQVADRFGKRHVRFFSSGRGAVSAALNALHTRFPARDEVVIPAYTSFSVASAVVHAGFKVRLYDVDPETLGPDAQSLKRALSDRSLCLMVCHLFGCPADMDTARTMAGEHGVPLFDDAAQAMGAAWKGRLAGTFGDIGLFSLSRGKNISAVDGGILVTNEDWLAEALDALAPEPPSAKEKVKLWLTALALCFLLHPRLYWIPNSLPFLKLGESHFDPDFGVAALTPFQAGLGIRMLRRLDRINAGRRRVAVQWMNALKGRKFPSLPEGGDSVWLRLPLLDSGAGEVMKEYGVVPSYPSGLHEIEALRPHLAGSGSYPGAERLARSLVTLPTQGYVTEQDIEHVARVLGGGTA
ncbi:aminotransferase class I/II-fold pyridoxal phosphate-dependent enzyme [Pseudodesulfovibrio thermohalotolerans]|uniref:DegT/DnrJ/EryC1/StrS family aminotransferase n=1 Tax=Pseudodesulfovibrio thermohalotolerans TaxID=2880651 RepID=UPI0024427301|nr:aminotransferase class I/II-fold pyridoxal phosphate-dependent enzyme [Pseudodesulfovibrio thermohalotolerans]WFS61596.1 aminotransferase class I/II-fold pyridoxal phosphate-dependent enzyme [Pseudodesulfovibrio thermohalotolerans]